MANENTNPVSIVNTKMVFAADHFGPYRFGMNKLRELREKKGLNQYQLAKAMHTQQPQIARWEKEPDEKGYRKIPLQQARKAMKILDCMLSELRPDVLEDDSIDLLLEGAPKAVKREVYRFAKFQLQQK